MARSGNNACRSGGTWRAALFGGSFDPIHKGHLAIAKAAILEFKLDVLWLIPCRKNPLKKNLPKASDRDRLAMLRLACGKRSKIRVSDVEILRRGASYSYQTIRFFLKRYGPKAELFWIIGSDLAPELRRWKRWEWMRTRCRFACAARGGEKTHRLPAGVLCFKMKPVQISSSTVQRDAAEGAGLRKEVPDAVARYIRRRRIYSDALKPETKSGKHPKP